MPVKSGRIWPLGLQLAGTDLTAGTSIYYKDLIPPRTIRPAGGGAAAPMPFWFRIPSLNILVKTPMTSASNVYAWITGNVSNGPALPQVAARRTSSCRARHAT